MKWVDVRTFTGLDRRKRKPSLRFAERRNGDATSDPPSSASAIRQLRVRAMEANSPEGVRAFAQRAAAVAALAEKRLELQLSADLTWLAGRILSAPHLDWRARLDEHLGRIAVALGKR